MRKITRNTFDAWLARKERSFSNTETTRNGSVFLHGNEIVKVVDGDTFVSDGGYGYSRTTAERLKPWASFHRENWAPYMNGKPYVSGTWVKVK